MQMEKIKNPKMDILADVEDGTTLGAQVGPRESDCVRVGVVLSINKSPRELSRTTRISRKDLFSHNYEALPFHLRYKRCRTGSLYSFFFSSFFFSLFQKAGDNPSRFIFRRRLRSLLS